jgi:hypothetical protein
MRQEYVSGPHLQGIAVVWKVAAGGEAGLS